MSIYFNEQLIACADENETRHTNILKNSVLIQTRVLYGAAASSKLQVSLYRTLDNMYFVLRANNGKNGSYLRYNFLKLYTNQEKALRVFNRNIKGYSVVSSPFPNYREAIALSALNEKRDKTPVLTISPVLPVFTRYWKQISLCTIVLTVFYFYNHLSYNDCNEDMVLLVNELIVSMPIGHYSLMRKYRRLASRLILTLKMMQAGNVALAMFKLSEMYSVNVHWFNEHVNIVENIRLRYSAMWQQFNLSFVMSTL